MPIHAAEQLNRIRRRGEQLADQLAAKTTRAIRGGGLHVPFDGQPRFALLTVNYSTTRYLKLMLRTFAEQQNLDLIQTVVICDNHSRDGGISFLRELAHRARRIELVERRRWTNHAKGMRAAIHALDRRDQKINSEPPANILLACDPDVVYLRDDTLTDLAQVFADGTVAFAGQLRRHLYPLPEVQASFLAVRRDWAARKDVSPWVNHGSPAWWMQRDIWKQGGQGFDFPSNRNGYVLHRGRTAVAAARDFDPLSSYATTTNRIPHFMGVPNGPAIWRAKEEEYSEWLNEESEAELIRHLSSHFA